MIALLSEGHPQSTEDSREEEVHDHTPSQMTPDEVEMLAFSMKGREFTLGL